MCGISYPMLLQKKTLTKNIENIWKSPPENYLRIRLKRKWMVALELNYWEKICEIRHIAVSPSSRRESIGSKMINFILEKYAFDSVFAETDNDAVNFYEKYGFTIKGLGEKYPGVERFQCLLENN